MNPVAPSVEALSEQLAQPRALLLATGSACPRCGAKMHERRITSHILNLWRRWECQCGHNSGRFTPANLSEEGETAKAPLNNRGALPDSQEGRTLPSSLNTH